MPGYRRYRDAWETEQKGSILMDKPKKYSDHVIRYDIACKDVCTNIMQTSKIDRIVLNIGTKAVGRLGTIPALFALEFIAGQKPNITRAKKSIDRFKLRQNMPIGAKVTLRDPIAYAFLYRLVNSSGSSGIFLKKRSAPGQTPLMTPRRFYEASAGALVQAAPATFSEAFGLDDKALARFGEMERQHRPSRFWNESSSQAGSGLDIVIVTRDFCPHVTRPLRGSARHLLSALQIRS